MPRICACATLRAPFGPLRVMTTHLEYYSKRIRQAQAQALLDLHAQACALASAAPAAGDAGTPFSVKPHTSSALLCGDFNLGTDQPEHALLQRATEAPTTRFVDAWPVVHGAAAPRAPTFCVHEQRYAPAPFACDFMFVTEDLVPRVHDVQVDGASRASDHQPVVLTLES
jgi:endonuclease/exonuclease/phosphatase family metal-dependent hydrolase